MFTKKDYLKQWRKNNPEKVKEQRERYCEKHQDKLREDRKRWAENNPTYKKEYMEKWRIDNKEYLKEYQKEYNKVNKESINKCNKKWKENNKENIKKYQQKNKAKKNLWHRERSRTNLKYSLNKKMKCSIYNAVKSNKAGKSWEDLVGYTLNDLIKRLKNTMPEGYCWQDYLDGRLHIDHIVPISAHNFTKPEHIDFKYCWSLKNLRLLPAKENLKKSNKLSKPFQPALKIMEQEGHIE